jgi:hypothetical protein
MILVLLRRSVYYAPAYPSARFFARMAHATEFRYGYTSVRISCGLLEFKYPGALIRRTSEEL